MQSKTVTYRFLLFSFPVDRRRSAPVVKRADAEEDDYNPPGYFDNGKGPFRGRPSYAFGSIGLNECRENKDCTSGRCLQGLW